MKELLDVIFTGRNEVLAKIIFSQASVILFMGGGVSNFSEGSSKFSGVSNFSGGGFLQIFRGSPIFQGGPAIFRGVSNFWGGLLWNTVNVRPVRILLECILVRTCSYAVMEIVAVPLLVINRKPN